MARSGLYEPSKGATMAIENVLSAVQKSIKAPKAHFNKFGGYKYRTAEDIIEAVKKVLPENASILISDDIQLIGNRYYVKATATLKLGEASISASAFAREAENKKGMDDAQITGSASSYARKYALNGLFAIDEGVDMDTHDNRDAPKKEAAKEEPKKLKNYAPKAEPKKQGTNTPIPESKGELYTYLNNFMRVKKVSQDDVRDLSKELFGKDSVNLLLLDELKTLTSEVQKRF